MHHETPLIPSLANVGKLFKTTQAPAAQSSRINDIQHTIPFVTKPTLAYILNQTTNYLNKGMT
jgi:hypothetical protein